MDNMSHENTGMNAELFAQTQANCISMTKDSDAAKSALRTKEVGKYVLKAIEQLQGQEGSPTREIKNVLASKYKLNVKEKTNEIATFLKDAVKSGGLIKADGKYKMAERARRRRSTRSGGRRRTKSGGRSRTRSRKSGGRKRSRSRRRRSTGRRKKSGGRRSTRRRRRSRKHKHTPGDECDM